MKKSNRPNGLSLSQEFKELVKRLKDKEPELDAIINRQEGKLDRQRTFDHLKAKETVNGRSEDGKIERKIESPSDIPEGPKPLTPPIEKWDS